MASIASSSTSQEMMSYFLQLNDKEKKSVLNLVKTFLLSRKENLTPQSLQEYNTELEQADAEIALGDYVTHEEVKKIYLSS